MEDLFLKIGDRLQASLPELSLIDEDCGQLQPVEGEEDYPVTFPCALIDTAQIDWHPDKAGKIRGRGSVIVKLAFDCYEDTHLSAGTRGQMHRRADCNLRMWAALHQYCFGEGYSPMQLVQSRTYSIYGRKKVYESTFSINASVELPASE